MKKKIRYKKRYPFSLSAVNRIARGLQSSDNVTWSEAFKVAWLLHKKAVFEVTDGAAFIVYEKADGSRREAISSVSELAGYQYKGTGRKTPSQNMIYWDSAAGGIRSFVKLRLLEVLPLSAVA